MKERTGRTIFGKIAAIVLVIMMCLSLVGVSALSTKADDPEGDSPDLNVKVTNTETQGTKVYTHWKVTYNKDSEIDASGNTITTTLDVNGTDTKIDGGVDVDIYSQDGEEVSEDSATVGTDGISLSYTVPQAYGTDYEIIDFITVTDAFKLTEAKKIEAKATDSISTSWAETSIQPISDTGFTKEVTNTKREGTKVYTHWKVTYNKGFSTDVGGRTITDILDVNGTDTTIDGDVEVDICDSYNQIQFEDLAIVSENRQSFTYTIDDVYGEFYEVIDYNTVTETSTLTEAKTITNRVSEGAASATAETTIAPLGSLKVSVTASGNTIPDSALFTVTDAAGNVAATKLYSEFKTAGSFTVTDLTPGNYTVEESGADISGWTLTVSGNENAVAVSANQTAEMTITDTYTEAPTVGSLKVSVTASGNTIPDAAIFTVKNAAGTAVATKTYAEYKTEGSFTVTDLTPGNYTVEESGADISGWTLTVSGNENAVAVSANQTAEMTITDTYTAAPVVGSLKVTVAASGNTIPDSALFTVTDAAGNVAATKLYSEFKTAGSFTLENLAPGNYTITESGAEKDGYLLTISGNRTTISTVAGQVTSAAIQNVYTLTSVSIAKVDASTGKLVAGAHIQILDKDGKVVQMYDTASSQYVTAEWDSTTSAKVVNGLSVDVTYTLHETKAPAGYSVTGDTTFTLKEDGTIDTTKTTTTIGNGTTGPTGVLLVRDQTSSTNTNGSTSNTSSTAKSATTGDESNVVLYVLLAAIAAIVLLALGFAAGRKKA